MKSYLFPGQGSQIKGMGATLFDEFPEMTEKADDILGYSIKDLCLKDEKRQLNQTDFTQPALYVVNALSYQRKKKEIGQKPDFLAGHSLGEYNALQSAGVFSFEDGLKLVRKRGKLMNQAENGAMAAIIKLTEKEIKQCIEENGLSDIDIANYNGPKQIVISGLGKDIKKAQSHFEKAGGLFIPLNTSGAFHSRYMNDAKSIFEEYIQEFKFNELQIPVISNVYARPYEQDQIKRCLSDQINNSVKWTQSMQYLLEQGEMEFEELGVGNVLTKLMQEIQSYFVGIGQNRKGVQSEADQNHEPAELKQNKAASISSSFTANVEDDAEPVEVGKREDLKRKIYDWNNKYPIGSKVTVAGYEKEMETRTKAMVLFGHRAAIYMQGYKGYFDLDDVTPVAGSRALA